jgi:AcrR family transcriptional regulator
MLKKLTQEQQEGILERAIEAFGEQGPERTAMADVAKRAGVSVGVLYKYYENKDDLFRACLRRSLDYLSETVEGAAEAAERDAGAPLPAMAGALIRACQTSAREHPSYFRLYHAITLDPVRAAEYAGEIERASAKLYAEYAARAQAAGGVRADVPPELIAFFLDNVLMMLHFSYSCDYYRERLRLYGADPADEKQDGAVAEAMLRLFTAAVGAKS